MFALTPIGLAHTSFTTEGEIPREGGGPASVELFPEYAAGLEGIEHNTHVWIVGWFDRASRSVTTRGRNLPPTAPLRGVFSMRSPSRPNPLGLTCARLLARRGNVLELDRLDFRDQTPVVDLKPYSPGWDLIPSATSGHRYDPSRYTRDELAQALSRNAQNALGPGAGEGSQLLVLLEALNLLTFDCGVDIRAPETLFEISNADERVEVLLCATGASLGNRRLRIGAGEPGAVLQACIAGGSTWVAFQSDSGLVLQKR